MNITRRSFLKKIGRIIGVGAFIPLIPNSIPDGTAASSFRASTIHGDSAGGHSHTILADYIYDHLPEGWELCEGQTVHNKLF